MSDPKRQLARMITEKACKLLQCVHVEGVEFAPYHVSVDESTYSTIVIERVNLDLGSGASISISITMPKEKPKGDIA